MKRIQLKEHVRGAIRSQWPAFEREHPRLAAVLDESLLVDAAVEVLEDDEEYQEAMAHATAAGVGAEVVGDVVVRLVSRWLQHLVAN